LGSDLNPGIVLEEGRVVEEGVVAVDLVQVEGEVEEEVVEGLEPWGLYLDLVRQDVLPAVEEPVVFESHLL